MPRRKAAKPNGSAARGGDVSDDRHMEISFRFGQAEDIDAVADLVIDAGGGLYEFLLDGLVPGVSARNMIRYAVSDESTLFSYTNGLLAEQGDEVLGLALCYPGDEFGLPWIVRNVIPRRRLDRVRALLEADVRGTLYLNSLAVTEAARGGGVGRLLLGCVGELTAELALDTVTLHVWADNEPAIGLYRSSGFEIVETIPIEPHERLPHEGGMHLMSAPLPLRADGGAGAGRAP